MVQRRARSGAARRAEGDVQAGRRDRRGHGAAADAPLRSAGAGAGACDPRAAPADGVGVVARGGRRARRLGAGRRRGPQPGASTPGRHRGCQRPADRCRRRVRGETSERAAGSTATRPPHPQGRHDQPATRRRRAGVVRGAGAQEQGRHRRRRGAVPGGIRRPRHRARRRVRGGLPRRRPRKRREEADGRRPADAARRRPAPPQAAHRDGRGRALGRVARRPLARRPPDAACGAAAGIGAMRAACWTGRNSVAVENVPDPQILNERDAIVRVTSTAICGSDLHLYDGYIPGVKRGDILGHEFMGEVVEVGDGVRTLRTGDRVIVPFPIACGACTACSRELYSLCENSNPNAGMAEKLWGYSPAGLFGYSHMLGGYPGGQAEYVRVPFADVGPLKVPDELSDEQVLFLSDVFPTGYMGAELCDIQPGGIVAVWGAGPVGQLAAASARLLGAEQVIVIDRISYRLRIALDRAGATDVINYEELDVLTTLREMTGGRGPDACIDCVGMEAR